MQKQMLAGLIVAGCLVAAAAFVLLSRERAPVIVDAPASYSTEGECKATTGAAVCVFVTCDLVPDGKTFEETCGRGFRPGWRPR